MGNICKCIVINEDAQFGLCLKRIVFLYNLLFVRLL